MKCWEEITEFSLENIVFGWNLSMLYLALGKNILEDRGNASDLCVYHNHLIKNSRVYCG